VLLLQQISEIEIEKELVENTRSNVATTLLSECFSIHHAELKEWKPYQYLEAHHVFDWLCDAETFFYAFTHNMHTRATAYTNRPSACLSATWRSPTAGWLSHASPERIAVG
jgi:hypothetical protein